MWRYILIRGFIYVPTLMAISIAVFLLSRATPGDPVDSFLFLDGVEEKLDPDTYKKEYTKLSKSFGYDKPLFYWTIRPRNPDQVSLPYITWNGSDNQYHLWVSGILRGDWGLSWTDGQEVWTKISKSLPWTLFMSVVALILSFSIGIPLGVYSSSGKKMNLKKSVEYFSLAFYSIPVFWLATLLIVYFTTDDYGSWTNVFPSIGISPGANVLGSLDKLILPVFCLIIHSFSLVLIHMRSSMDNQVVRPYYLTALTKGLSSKSATWHHAFRNACLPVISIFVASIPGLIAGSVVIEVIFNIPGMGRLIYDSILSADWNVVYAILMLIGLITVVSNLMGDLIYTWVDPRIRYDRKHV